MEEDKFSPFQMGKDKLCSELGAAGKRVLYLIQSMQACLKSGETLIVSKRLAC